MRMTFLNTPIMAEANFRYGGVVRTNLYAWSIALALIASIGSTWPTFAQPVAKVTSGTMERMENVSSKHVDPRHIDVWLPEGYNAQKRYSVVYMQDGQNLFDVALAYGGNAWQADQAVTRLMRSGRIADTIIVGIWNNGMQRYAEYYPEKVLAFAPGATRREYVDQASNGRSQADAYLRFIVEELKPAIDRKYATNTGQESTFIVGSSMGGLISIYALCEYPRVFGGAAGLSTHWIGKPTAWGRERIRNAALPLAAMTYLSRALPVAGNHRIYTDRGDDWLDSLYQPAHRFVEEVLRDRGYTEVDSMTRIFHGTGHGERDWAARLDGVLVFLMGRKSGDK